MREGQSGRGLTTATSRFATEGIGSRPFRIDTTISLIDPRLRPARALVTNTSEQSTSAPASCSQERACPPPELTEADVVRESLSALLGCSSALSSDKARQTIPHGLTEQVEAIGALADTFAQLRRFAQIQSHKASEPLMP